MEQNYQEEEQKIRGIITRVLFRSEESDFHVLKVSQKDEDDELNGKEKEHDDPNNEITVVIEQPELYEGMSLEFTGKWDTHPKFGPQFKAKEGLQVKPINKEALRKYLSSDMFPGIGAILSKRIIDHFGDDVLDIFNEDIDRIKEIPMVSNTKLKYIKKKWKENETFNHIMLFLKEHNISHLFSKRIYDAYGDNAISQIRSEPYGLFKHIKGIGFKYADKIALELGFEKDHEKRLKAAIEYCLSEFELKGHCYLTKEQLISNTKKLLDIDDKKRINTIIDELNNNREIATVRNKDEDTIRYYSYKIYDDEVYCCDKIRSLKKKKKTIANIDKKIEDIEEERQIELTKEQKEAIVQSLSNGVSIITGGPGCGKTMTCDILIDVVMKGTNKEILVLAPTGRAAKKISEINHEAPSSTIHKALCWISDDDKRFHFDENNPLPSDVILVDESSMMDIHIASDLLRAIKKDAQVIFVGDKDQLPPVGPGNFFKDLIISEEIETIKLDKIFRQSKASNIIIHAHEINQGKVPQISSPIKEPGILKNRTTDCLFIDSSSNMFLTKNEYPKESSMRYGRTAIDMIEKMYIDTIPNNYDINEIQILAPMNVGDIGNNVINERIREISNPPSKKKKEINIKKRTFREGDKIIQKENNYDLAVFNGDIGKIEKIYSEENLIFVRFPEKTVEYSKDNLLDTDLAYSISIHKAQGCEFECAIIMVLSNYSIMLNRNLYYTALTRAKKLAVMIGEREALEKATSNNENNKRQTSLKETLEGKIEIYEELPIKEN